MDAQGDNYDVSALVAAGGCDEALHTLYHFLDGELTPEKRRAIQTHLDNCAPCLHAFDFEADLKMLVARSCRDQVPEALKQKIAHALAQASKDDPGHV